MAKEQKQAQEIDENLDISEEDLKQLGMEPLEQPEEPDQPDDTDTAETEPPATTAGAGEETFEIVHNGQVHRVTKDKLIELAQKGFDYDYKVGPHSKIAQLIETDPEIAKIVNDYWQARVSGTQFQPSVPTTTTPQSPQAQQLQQQAQELNIELEPLDKYETETDWLRDNLARIQPAVEAQITQRVMQQIQPHLPPPPQQPDAKQILRQALAYHDPQNLETMLPHIVEELTNNVPIARFQKIDIGLQQGDPSELFKLYDEVKQRVTQGQQPAQSRQSQQVRQTSFKVKPGSGSQPKQGGSDKYDYPWNLPKEKFQQQLEKLKGY